MVRHNSIAIARAALVNDARSVVSRNGNHLNIIFEIESLFLGLDETDLNFASDDNPSINV